MNPCPPQREKTPSRELRMHTARTHITDARQESFLTCYRGGQNDLRHAAYMRMGKVLLLQYLLTKWNVPLREQRILDYGFGAGTFFRYCPLSSHLFGVEQDPICVREVSEMLYRRGHRQVELQPMEIANWQDHPLLENSYDLIVCSHVLEHIPDPQSFLQRIAGCLKRGALFAGLVPVNERRLDPHHVRQIDLPVLREWLPAARLELVDWIEGDPWLYWLQPLFTYDSRILHSFTQFLSLTLGLTATSLGYIRWFRLSGTFGRVSRSKPTQAAFLLRPVAAGQAA
jgi:SAM-dependent methyltransferase